MDLEAKLDTLLFTLRDLEDKDEPIIWDQIIYKLCKLPPGERRGGWNVDHDEFDQLMKKLVADGFVKGGTANLVRIVTFEGRMFEGYVSRRQRTEGETRLKSFQTWAIVIATILAALGSISLVIIELMKK
jgi:hypothetical protein